MHSPNFKDGNEAPAPTTEPKGGEIPVASQPSELAAQIARDIADYGTFDWSQRTREIVQAVVEEHLASALAASDSRARAAEERAEKNDALLGLIIAAGDARKAFASAVEAKERAEAEAAALRKALREALEELYAELRSNYHSFEPDKEKWIAENVARLSALLETNRELNRRNQELKSAFITANERPYHRYWKGMFEIWKAAMDKLESLQAASEELSMAVEEMESWDGRVSVAAWKAKQKVDSELTKRRTW